MLILNVPSQPALSVYGPFCLQQELSRTLAVCRMDHTPSKKYSVSSFMNVAFSYRDHIHETCMCHWKCISSLLHIQWLYGTVRWLGPGGPFQPPYLVPHSQRVPSSTAALSLSIRPMSVIFLAMIMHVIIIILPLKVY